MPRILSNSYNRAGVTGNGGNISQMSVAYRGGATVTRKYGYDRLNRLTSQTSTDGYDIGGMPAAIDIFGDDRFEYKIIN